MQLHDVASSAEQSQELTCSALQQERQLPAWLHGVSQRATPQGCQSGGPRQALGQPVRVLGQLLGLRLPPCLPVARVSCWLCRPAHRLSLREQRMVLASVICSFADAGLSAGGCVWRAQQQHLKGCKQCWAQTLQASKQLTRWAAGDEKPLCES